MYDSLASYNACETSSASPMRYRSSTSLTGDAGRAFDLALTSLTSQSFHLTSRRGTSVEFEGPGMRSTNQSALLGATTIRLVATAGQLELEADLGGVRFLTRRLFIFPLALLAFLFITFAVVYSAVFNQEQWHVSVVASIVGNALLWLVVAPIIAIAVRARTVKALDTLLHNVASAGQAV
ncbi:MAG: hypothetical protein QF735_00665 [Phycisphaeraceae bacterium]|jgi:hypothetical protein|nr:hypothetical protein [Phycisphaeraceae bacterium]